LTAPQQPRALVIDDDPLIGRALCRNLSRSCATTLCSGALEALARLRAGEVFDLVLCDVTMPDMGGPEFYEQAVALDPSLGAKIVLVTGGATTDQMRRASKLGARCLLKPLSAETVAGLVDEARARLA
jgi:two-component system NtrC family sensor kinase